MLAGLLRSVALAASLAVLSSPAWADIKAFNAAVKAGDYKAAAAAAKTIWPTWDKAHVDTAVMAREFGFASYVAGDYAEAAAYGKFLSDHGATLKTPDDQPVVSRVLLAAANFRLKADANTRTALLESLKGREGQPGIDHMSALAAEALYRSDWNSTKWAETVESAEMAQRLLARGGATLQSRALEARGTAATAHFLRRPDKEDYDRIVDAHDAVIDAIDGAMDPRKRLALIPLKFQLEAWTVSIGNYFKGSQQTGSNVPVRVRERDLKRPAQALFPDAVMTGDQCKSPEISWPKLDYPSAAAFSGTVGTVITKLDTDAQGRVVKSETLAAVPARHFAETVERGAPNIVYRRSSQDAPGCSLAATSRVVYAVFRIL